jgi:Toprim-like/Protein of unknown function (DUF3991)
MVNRAEELEAFKTQINLGEYAASLGYVLDRKASSRSSAVLTRSDGDKIVVAVGKENHWIYFSVRDDADNGSIIDFVQRRNGGSLGIVRAILRPWLDVGHSPALPSTFPTLEPAEKDLVRVHARFESMAVTSAHPYLLTERKIPAEVLSHPRFFDRVRTDDHGNAVFPHWNISGLSGYEVKNRGFTGFSPGGEKGLWGSHTDSGDLALVISETAIDALSHVAIKRPALARYVSTAGSLNSSQPNLIRRAAEKLPAVARVILATDNDDGGDTLASFFREFLAPLASRLEIVDERPTLRGDDWNDVLRKCGPP